MKIIHCADLHLDSKLNANLDRDRARERRAELLQTFVRMVEYAFQNDVEAILIAGDLFDTGNISAGARNTVLQTIRRFSKIRFYYIKGNHDRDNFLTGEETLPENLKLFDEKWKDYREAGGRICITGMELTKENAEGAPFSLVPEADCFRIVMLHGQETESTGRDRAEIINLKNYRGKGIDYLALGHIHGYKMEALDARGNYCYPGCLEGRGFDECGTHGFVLLDIDEATGHYTAEFVPFATRTLYTVEADVTGCETTADLAQRAGNALELAGCEPSSLVKLVLTGSLAVDCEKDTGFLQKTLERRFYFLKVVDETGLFIDYKEYLLDQSLKGEFVRRVMADETLLEEEKPVVIRYGLQALAGEEVGTI